MMIETDVLVVGAGPAGSSAARHAAKGGAEVLLIDKKAEMGTPKRCAEGVSKNGLKKLSIKPESRWIAAEMDRVRLVSPGGIDVWLNQKTSNFRKHVTMWREKINIWPWMQSLPVVKSW